MIKFAANLILSLLGLGVIAKNSAYFSWLWQLKEYRWDRLKSSLKERPLKSWLKNTGWVKLGFLCLLFGFITRGISFPLIYLKGGLILVLAFEILQGVKAAQKRQLKKPQFTLKGITLFLLTASSTILFWLLLGTLGQFSLLPWIGAFLIAERALGFLNLFWLLCLKPPTYFYKRYLFQKAKKRVASASNLVKIGITGSYGKSTTKEILSQILSSNYEVLKTPENTNSTIGIAKVMLEKLKPDHDIIICEMGAYKKGEIKKSAQIVSPQIGIITGITNQHQALFGSLENIKEAKYELIEALPKNGLALFNGENYHCRKLEKKTEQTEAHLYGTKEAFSFKAQNIELKPDGSSFDFFTPKEKKEIKLNLLGLPSIENFVGAAGCAYKIGTSLETIAQEANNLESSLSSLTLAKGTKGTTVINDSYSANPEGAKAACRYLKKAFPKKEKIVVLRTLIELGSKAKETHKNLGKILAQTADRVYIASSEFAKTIKKSAIEAGFKEERIQIIPNPQKLKSKLEAKLDSNQVILIEGRVNKVISDYILGR